MDQHARTLLSKRRSSHASSETDLKEQQHRYNSLRSWKFVSDRSSFKGYLDKLPVGCLVRESGERRYSDSFGVRLLYVVFEREAREI